MQFTPAVSFVKRMRLFGSSSEGPSPDSVADITTSSDDVKKRVSQAEATDNKDRFPDESSIGIDTGGGATIVPSSSSKRELGLLLGVDAKEEAFQATTKGEISESSGTVNEFQTPGFEMASRPDKSRESCSATTGRKQDDKEDSVAEVFEGGQGGTLVRPSESDTEIEEGALKDDSEEEEQSDDELEAEVHAGYSFSPFAFLGNDNRNENYYNDGANENEVDCTHDEEVDEKESLLITASAVKADKGAPSAMDEASSVSMHALGETQEEEGTVFISSTTACTAVTNKAPGEASRFDLETGIVAAEAALIEEEETEKGTDDKMCNNSDEVKEDPKGDSLMDVIDHESIANNNQKDVAGGDRDHASLQTSKQEEELEEHEENVYHDNSEYGEEETNDVGNSNDEEGETMEDSNTDSTASVEIQSPLVATQEQKLTISAGITGWIKSKVFGSLAPEVIDANKVSPDEDGDNGGRSKDDDSVSIVLGCSNEDEKVNSACKSPSTMENCDDFAGRRSQRESVAAEEGADDNKLSSADDSKDITGCNNEKETDDFQNRKMTKESWTPLEVAALREGMAKYGGKSNRWVLIKADPEFSLALERRTNVDLKDRWRTRAHTPVGVAAALAATLTSAEVTSACAATIGTYLNESSSSSSSSSSTEETCAAPGVQNGEFHSGTCDDELIGHTTGTVAEDDSTEIMTSNSIANNDDESLIGLRIRKSFGSKWIDGVVSGWDDPYWVVTYEDGEMEEMDNLDIETFTVDHQLLKDKSFSKKRARGHEVFEDDICNGEGNCNDGIWTGSSGRSNTDQQELDNLVASMVDDEYVDLKKGANGGAAGIKDKHLKNKNSKGLSQRIIPTEKKTKRALDFDPPNSDTQSFVAVPAQSTLSAAALNQQQKKVNASASTSGMKPTKREAWTPTEELALQSGIDKYRHRANRWALIKIDPDFCKALERRTNVNLKDKWRTMCNIENRNCESL